MPKAQLSPINIKRWHHLPLSSTRLPFPSRWGGGTLILAALLLCRGALADITTPAMPASLAYRPASPTPGNTFLPRSHRPARRILLVDTSHCTADELDALLSLQGLTSRRHPCLWLRDKDDDNSRCVERNLVDNRYIDQFDIVSDWHTLFRRFAWAYKGAVVPDPELYRGDTVAANVAGVNDLIVASPELASKLGIPVKVDLRGRFSTYAEALDWVCKTYHAKLNHRVCLIARDLTYPASYAIQWRATIFWPSGSVDGAAKSADPAREKALVARIMSEMAPNSAMLGYPWSGDGVGVGEGDGVELASRYGISLVASDSLANICVLSGVPIKALTQKPQPPAPALERDKIYIALAMSDGDNMGSWRWMWKDFFENKRYGDFPLAFGIGPSILDLQPSVAQWYYDHAAPNTEFIADVSGIGYMQPGSYGQAFQKPQEVLNGFLDWTRLYDGKLGIRTLRTVDGGDDILAAYAARLPDHDSLFADMGRDDREGIANLTYTLPNSSVPIFRSVTSWRYGKEGFLREVRDQVGSLRPAFVNGFVHIWTFRMPELADIYDHRDKDMVFVTPTQLASLYKQAIKRGWTH